MKATEFCYWLQGYFELGGDTALTEEQVKMVRAHLNLVFKHDIDPSYGGDPQELQDIHDGKTLPGTKPQFPGPLAPRPPRPGGGLLRC